MNILFIAKNVTLCSRSGDAIHVRELAEQLAKLGHKIFLVGRDLEYATRYIYDDYRKSLDNLHSNKNIEIILMRSKAKLAFSINRDYQALKQSIRILRTNKIDLIYSRSFNAYLEGFLMNLFQVPLVLEINGLELDEREALLGKRNYYRKEISKTSSIQFFQYPSKIITITDKLKRSLIDDFDVNPKKLYIVPNGVNEMLFRPDPSQNEALRQQLDIPKDSPVICFVGAFDPWHGLEGLVSSAKVVVEQEPTVKYLMVGDGYLKDEIERTVRNYGLETNFKFTGRVPYIEVPKLINISNICVVPYPKKNAFLVDWAPLKLYEYMSCGKSVIATDVGNVARVVRKSGSGVLVKPDDPEDLARGTLELIKDVPRQKKLGARGRNYVISNCTWKQTAEKVSKLIESVNESNQTRSGYL
ncbi:MAG: glycosyltransferase family 4 protein [Thermoplasmata archaeon]|nr:MAG: glycosyltransferase family 4 protein [Thermoplasmata archaeon]